MSAETKRGVRNAILLVVLTVFVGAGVFFLTLRTPPEIVPAAVPKPESPAPDAVQATAPTPASVEPAKPVHTATPSPGPAAVPALEMPKPAVRDISGLWELSIQQGDESRPEARLRIGIEDGVLKASLEQNGEPIGISLNGMKLVMSFKEPQLSYTFDGTMNPSYTAAAGTLEVVGRPPNPGEPEPKTVYDADFVLVPADQLKQEIDTAMLREKREADAKALFAALKAFAARNNGKFPATLSQLTADDLKDPRLIPAASDRRITYNPEAAVDVDRDKFLAINDEFKKKEASRETMVEWERQIREVWGNDVPMTPVVLRVEYDNPPYSVDINASGMLNESELPAGDYANLSSDVAAAMRASEMNNMKQLMLVCKMFETENRGYLPGGWTSVYPEYLTDPNVLHSPWAAPGTLSYDLLFPGYQESDLFELATQLIESGSPPLTFPEGTDSNSPAWEALLSSAIPAVVSREILPSEPGKPPARAVAFLDGHVEAVLVSEWDTRIAPFQR